MKKIMFNDKYGLTKAVLEGRKTMTRRLPNKSIKDLMPELAGHDLSHAIHLPFKVGDVVAVAQSYEDIHKEMMDDSFGEGYGDGIYDAFRWAIVDNKPGWTNKMFVKAELMPHRIRITNVRAERLQDISEEDCLREGIIEDCPGVQYSFPTEIGYCGQYPFYTPRGAFADLIDKVSGKGTFESNPYVFVYEFELVK